MWVWPNIIIIIVVVIIVIIIIIIFFYYYYYYQFTNLLHLVYSTKQPVDRQ